MIQIREAGIGDKNKIQEIHLRAFAKDEGSVIAALAGELLQLNSTPPTFSLLAEVESQAVGHITFSPVCINEDPRWKGYILAPLGVVPEFQKKGVGSTLIETGMTRLSEQDVHTVLVYGDPDYYSNFGFEPEVAEAFQPPHKLEYPFGWQGVNLNEYCRLSKSKQISCVGPLNDPTLW